MKATCTDTPLRPDLGSAISINRVRRIVVDLPGINRSEQVPDIRSFADIDVLLIAILIVTTAVASMGSPFLCHIRG